MELYIPHGKCECRGKVNGQHSSPCLRSSLSLFQDHVQLQVPSTDLDGMASDKCHTSRPQQGFLAVPFHTQVHVQQCVFTVAMAPRPFFMEPNYTMSSLKQLAQ